MVMENQVPELCEKCQAAKDDLISIKNGIRCKFACQTRDEGNPAVHPSLYGPYDGCALKVIAECGHRTDVLKYDGKCIGADNCGDYQPEKGPKPWWKFW